MSDPAPLFLTCTARSGGTLLSMMLSAHRQLSVTSDPYLPLFRGLRNACVEDAGSISPDRPFDRSAPIQDYYFDPVNQAVMDLVRAANLRALSVSGEDRAVLQAACRDRAALQATELVPYVDALAGPTYYHLFEQAVSIIARARQAESARWVGFKDSWIIEFFEPLARAFPDAHFVVVLRDPRATVHSMLGMARTEPDQVAHVLSYARHWRKLVAFILHYRLQADLGGRLHVLRHEDLLQDPRREAARLCDFLDVEFDPGMVDPHAFIDPGTKRPWAGNSSFKKTMQGFEPDRAHHWVNQLDTPIRRLVDLVCGPEMRLAGYAPLETFDAEWPPSDMLDYLVASDRAFANWRSDSGDVLADYASELFRLHMLNAGTESRHHALIRRCFLFDAVYRAVRSRDPFDLVRAGALPREVLTRVEETRETMETTEA